MPTRQMVLTLKNSAPARVEDKVVVVVEVVRQCTLHVANMMNTSGLTTTLIIIAVTLWKASN